MNRLDHKRVNLQLRKARVRSHLKGSAKKPRLSVYISNRHVSAQIIDDETGRTLIAASTIGGKDTNSTTEKCKKVGADIAKKAAKAKIKQVVFDRNGRSYQQRLGALADAARENGLEF